MKYPSNFLPDLNISQTALLRNGSVHVAGRYSENELRLYSREYIFFSFFATIDDEIHPDEEEDYE
jgi:hypothetical protein